ncbi:hypothetical protein LINPERPRIM_LOCUS28749 [Linum perenne]
MVGRSTTLMTSGGGTGTSLSPTSLEKATEVMIYLPTTDTP